MATITLTPGTTYQTIYGWEAYDYAADWDLHNDSWPLYRDELMYLLMSECGLNQLRLEIFSGQEHTIDYGEDFFIDRSITEAAYNSTKFTTTNDNADPDVILASGFKYGTTQYKMDNFVEILKSHEQPDNPLYITLCYVGGGPATLHTDADEYGEFILAAFNYLDSTYGYVPDAVDVCLEPNLGGPSFTAQQMGDNMVAAGARLAAAGFYPDFVGPSCSTIPSSVTYFDTMINVTGILDYWKEVSYHRYVGTGTDLANLKSRADSNGLRMGMLEWWVTGNGPDTLWTDLKDGGVSSWQWGEMAGTGTPNTFTSFYRVDDSIPASPVIAINTKTKLLRQVFLFVKRGAVRYLATSDDGNFDPVAFINPGDKHVVCVKSTTSGSIDIEYLPAGTYQIKYTTDSAYNVDLSNQTVNGSQTLSTSIPAAGIITVYKHIDPIATPFSKVGFGLKQGVVIR